MATNNSLESEKNYSATAENNELENGGFNLRMLLDIVLGNWFWILLSVILFGAAGWYYLKITPNTYQRTALVVIKEDSPQRGKDLNAMFANLGQNPDQSNVNNEMAAIQAPSNVLETVKRLNLDMNYTMEGRWHKNILYGRSLPANVRMMGLGDHESAAMQMELQPRGDRDGPHKHHHRYAGGQCAGHTDTVLRLICHPYERSNPRDTHRPLHQDGGRAKKPVGGTDGQDVHPGPHFL